MIELRRGLDNLTRAKYTARFTTIKRDRELCFIIWLMSKYHQGKYSIRLKYYQSELILKEMINFWSFSFACKVLNFIAMGILRN